MRDPRPAHPAARESRIERVARFTIGAAAANFAFLAFLTRLYVDSPVWLDVVVVAFGALSLLTAVLWATTRWFVTPRGIRVFIVFADIGTSVVLTSIRPVIDILTGCVLFGVIGLMAVFYLPRRWLVVHTVVATTATLVFAAVAVVDGYGLVAVVVRVDIVIAAVVAPILTVELAWRSMRRRAVLASTDPLTGVSNIRAMWSAMAAMVVRSSRTGERVAVAVVDIDRFKAVNDEFGHDAGDEVIRTVASELVAHVGDLGVVARSGGEEFTIVLIHRDVGVLHDRLCAVPTRVGNSGHVPDVTLSVGVAFVAHDAAGAPRDVAGAAYRQADKVMYEQKRAGGDGVRVGR